MYSFLAALQLLTRIPVPISFSATDRQQGRSVLYYPLIGLLIGLILVLAASSLRAFPPSLQAALLLAGWVLLTGGLHLDGLADCADAWAGGLGDPEKTRRIMKDPAVGSIAVVVLLLTLLLKWAVLQSLIDTQLIAALLAAPLLGRSAILALMTSAPYVSKQGLGDVLAKHLPATEIKYLIFVIVLSSVLLVGSIAVLSAIAMVVWIRATALRRLGGTTGDVYGAAVELVELAVMLGIAANG